MDGKVLAGDCGGGGGGDAVDDLKYISGLSTILVAHIQEVKDRVSQIEFIFCSQIFPHFQTKSKLYQECVADAVKAIKDEWRKRESSLVRQLEEVSDGKRLVEDKLLQMGISLEETKAIEDEWRKRESSLVRQLEELSHGKRLAEDKLLQMGNSLEEKKAIEDGWRKRESSLFRQLEELSNGKRLAEDKLLQLGSSLEETKAKLLDAERLVAMHEAEKKQILGRLEEEMRKGEVVHRLKREIQEKAAEVAREREEHQRLLLQVELKDKDLVLEQNKHKSTFEDLTKLKTDYKHLKSQYTYLLGKIDQNQVSKSLVGTSVDQKGPESPPSKRKLKELEHINKESVQAVSKIRDLKGSTSCTRTQAVKNASSVRSPLSSSRHTLSSHPTNSLPKNDAGGSKRESNLGLPVLHWRETRAQKESGVADPHDDFLNTPLEEVKNMIRNPTTPEEAQTLAASHRGMEFNNSDDETQDINIATQRLNNRPNMPVPKEQNKISVQPPKKEFKYRESVRKKADRENLKGVECKQCKKFYDAVLPDGRVNGDGVGSSLRCEHHDGVSRHRYRYAPPLTPEGFWNIGFESEM